MKMCIISWPSYRYPFITFDPFKYKSVNPPWEKLMDVFYTCLLCIKVFMQG